MIRVELKTLSNCKLQDIFIRLEHVGKVVRVILGRIGTGDRSEKEGLEGLNLTWGLGLG